MDDAATDSSFLYYNYHVSGGKTATYFYALIAVTTILVLLEIAFQIVIASIGTDFIEHCKLLDYLFRHLGFVDYKSLE